MRGQNKTVLITGSTSGFGKGFVSAFLKDGWIVVATLRNAKTRLHLFSDYQKEIESKKLFLHDLDVTQELERNRLQSWFENEHAGQLDCLINNAGYGLEGALEDYSDAQLRDQFNVNFFGSVSMIRGFLPLLKKSKGRVIQISSVLGCTSLPLSSAYVSSKHAIEGMIEALVYEVMPFGVQLALIEPGAFATGFEGSKVRGVNCLKKESPYTEMTQAFGRAREKILAKVAGDPKVVVRDVLALANKRKIPLRTVCGKDAKFNFLLKTFTTRNGYHRLMRAVFARILR